MKQITSRLYRTLKGDIWGREGLSSALSISSTLTPVSMGVDEVEAWCEETPLTPRRKLPPERKLPANPPAKRSTKSTPNQSINRSTWSSFQYKFIYFDFSYFSMHAQTVRQKPLLPLALPTVRQKLRL